MAINSVLARVEVDDLEIAIDQYRQLAGVDTVHRFTFGSIELAWVGPFLLLHGPRDALAAARRTATLIVDDMPEAMNLIAQAGGRTLEGPADGPNGTRLIAEFPGGAVFELIAPPTTTKPA
jgi:predicted enzyme related to lactoylglutathione lyase